MPGLREVSDLRPRRSVPWTVLTAAAWAILLALACLRSNEPAVLGLWSRSYAALLAALAAAVALVTLAQLRPALRAPLVLLAASTAVALSLAEIALRLFDPFGISYYGEMTRYILDRLPDPDLKFRQRPGFSAVYEGVELRFNEHGLRDDPIGPKPCGEYRILALGDSQTLGWGAPRDVIWPVRLSRLLSERLARPVRVINAGVAGYESRQEYRYLLRNGFALDPDLVLLLYLENDIEVNDDPYDPWREASLDGKSLKERLPLLLRKLRLYQLGFRAQDLFKQVRAAEWKPGDYGIPYDFVSSMRDLPGWKASMSAVAGMATSARERGLPFAAVYFSWTRRPFDDGLLESVRAAAAPYPVAYSQPWFEGSDVRRYFVSRTDSHPNAEGHRILAEHIASFLLEQGWMQSAAPPECH